MIKTLSIQTYSLRDVVSTREETKSTLKALKDYGYSGMQICDLNLHYGEAEFAQDAKMPDLK